MAKTRVGLSESKHSDLKALIQRHGAELSGHLQAHHRSIFPPEADKTIRTFSPAEAARLLGIHEAYLRQVVAEDNGFPRQ